MSQEILDSNGLGALYVEQAGSGQLVERHRDRYQGFHHIKGCPICERKF